MAEVASAEQDRVARDRYAQALAMAAEAVEGRLYDLVAGTAEEIIVTSLRPVLNEVVAEVEEIAAVLAPFGLDPAALLGAPEEARLARVRLDTVAARYGALRQAQSNLNFVQVDPGDQGRWAELKNYVELTKGFQPGRTPWPQDSTAAKLVWFIQNKGETWMPIAAERRALAEAEIVEYHRSIGRVDLSRVDVVNR